MWYALLMHLLGMPLLNHDVLLLLDHLMLVLLLLRMWMILVLDKYLTRSVLHCWMLHWLMLVLLKV
jgi:hypothetical protein